MFMDAQEITNKNPKILDFGKFIKASNMQEFIQRR